VDRYSSFSPSVRCSIATSGSCRARYSERSTWVSGRSESLFSQLLQLIDGAPHCLGAAGGHPPAAARPATRPRLPRWPSYRTELREVQAPGGTRQRGYRPGATLKLAGISPNTRRWPEASHYRSAAPPLRAKCSPRPALVAWRMALKSSRALHRRGHNRECEPVSAESRSPARMTRA
jgi:hypothetical protein